VTGIQAAGLRLLARRRVMADGLRTHPRHLALAGLVGGLVLGPRWPAGVALLAAVGLVLAGVRPAAPLVVLAVAVGALAGMARMEATAHFAPAAWFGHAIRGTAELTGPPQAQRWGGWRAPATLGGRWEGARVILQARSGTPVPPAGTGAVLAVRGGLRRLRPAEEYLRIRGVGGALDADVIIDRGAVRGGIMGTVDGIRRRAHRALGAGTGSATSALLVGMVLGDATALPPADADALRTAGLTHLVAASGANVALLVAFLLALGAVLGVPLRARLVLAILAISAYVPLAGAGPSIERAGIMGAATVVAVLAGRAAARWYALLLAAAVTLLLNPRAAEDPGWQLSFVAVTAILLGARPLASGLAERGLPRLVAEACGVTIVATLATAPVLAAHFDRLSLVSLPANLVAVVAVAPAMWLGFSAALVGQLSPSLAAPLTQLADVPAGFVLAVGRAAASVPHATVGAGWAPVALGAVLAGLGVLALIRPAPVDRSGRRRRMIAAGGATLIAVTCAGVGLVSGTRPVRAPDAFQVAFLDVGQGDATLLRHGADAILVDTGPPDGRILDRLHALGVTRLDVLVITHAQADHDGGAAAVLAATPVGVLLDGRDGVRDPPGERAATQARRRRVRHVTPVAGLTVRVGPMVLRVLSPPALAPGRRIAGADPNDRAVVATVADHGTVALLTADAESDVTDALALPHADLLKVAHHGSDDPGLPRLLNRVAPRVAVMEVGAHNTYGHPTPATVATLRRAVPFVGRTDRDGTILVTAAGRRLVARRHAP
jgi:competence protein ComEC